MRRKISTTLALLSAMLLGGCATTYPYTTTFGSTSAYVAPSYGLAPVYGTYGSAPVYGSYGSTTAIKGPPREGTIYNNPSYPNRAYPTTTLGSTSPYAPTAYPTYSTYGSTVAIGSAPTSGAIYTNSYANALAADVNGGVPCCGPRIPY